MMTTYSVPFYRDDGPSGVATGDLSLEYLAGRINRVRLYKTGYGFMVSPEGRFLSYPHKDQLISGKIQDLNRQLTESIFSGGGGFVEAPDPLKGRKSWIFYEDVGDTGFVVAFVYPEDEVLQEVRVLQRSTLIAGIIGLCGLLVLIILIADSITGPLSRLINGVSIVATGDLDHRIPMDTSTHEVILLGESINQMTGDLKMHINKIRSITEEKERISRELSLAREIQMAASPRNFQDLPARGGLIIYASLIPALEVGGDFYDFFALDDNRIGIVIGDASGKGIPAALFVTRSMAYLRSSALAGLNPGECLESVNRLLCSDDNLSMFVTLFYGILDPSTGSLEYCNGGHMPPFITKEDGEVAFLAERGGLVPGVMESACYRASAVKGVTGIFLYTDGVTDAENSRGEMFSNTRLQKVLGEIKFDNPRILINHVSQALKDFCGDGPQSDDITMLAVACGRGGEDHG